MLPDFLCLGAQKAGTTSIWKLLNAHPDVFLASPRETQFFSDDVRYAEGTQVYEARHFHKWCGQSVIGEKCPEYLYVPAVAERIHQTLGDDVRFVVTLRSPAQRAYSQYRHNVAALREVRAFEEAMEEELALLQAGRFVPPPFGYIGRGRYAEQLRRYLQVFKRDQFLIIEFQQDVCSDQRPLALRLYSFLGIRPLIPSGLPFHSGHPKLEELSVSCDVTASDPAQQYVRIESRRARGTIGQRISALLGRQRQKRIMVYRPSPELIRMAQHIQSLQVAMPRLSHVQEQEINHRYFGHDIAQLGDIVSFDTSAWLMPARGRHSEPGTEEAA